MTAARSGHAERMLEIYERHLATPEAQHALEELTALAKSGRPLCLLCYDERAKYVYWEKGCACRAKGPIKAECLLPAGHEGDHEGNGFDSYGPIGQIWADKKKRKAKA